MPPQEKKIQVTPGMLTNFAKNIRALQPDVDAARTELTKVNIKAGNFPDGTAFAKLVGLDQNGRATAYDKTLANLSRAITQLTDGLDSIAKGYTTTEEFNKNVSTDLGNLMAEVAPIINKAAPAAPAPDNNNKN
jgi:uncharacterized phage infection (PIP) family protein YhgE